MEKASRMYKAKTGVGCEPQKVPLDLTKEARREIVEFLNIQNKTGGRRLLGKNFRHVQRIQPAASAKHACGFDGRKKKRFGGREERRL